MPIGLAVDELSDEEMAAMLPPGDPLAGDSPIGLADLSGRAFILPEPASGLREVVIAACERAGFGPLPLFEISDPATVRHLVHCGLGVSIVPGSWFAAVGPEVAHVCLADPAPRHRVNAFTLTTGRSPAAELLVGALHAAFG
jgi:DNA-binding transcriptional LysR family regulator